MLHLAISGCGLGTVKALTAGAATAAAASEADTPEPGRLPPARFPHVETLRGKQTCHYHPSFLPRNIRYQFMASVSFHNCFCRVSCAVQVLAWHCLVLVHNALSVVFVGMVAYAVKHGCSAAAAVGRIELASECVSASDAGNRSEPARSVCCCGWTAHGPRCWRRVMSACCRPHAAT